MPLQAGVAVSLSSICGCSLLKRGVLQKKAPQPTLFINIKAVHNTTPSAFWGNIGSGLADITLGLSFSPGLAPQCSGASGPFSPGFGKDPISVSPATVASARAIGLTSQPGRVYTMHMPCVRLQARFISARSLLQKEIFALPLPLGGHR